jgi:glucose dehydrogenase
MFQHDLGHTGSAGFSDSPIKGELKWVFPTGAPIHSSPAVVDGTVYIGSRDWKLYAIDAETGVKRWEFQAETWIESSPAVVNGIVYFGSNDGRLYAVDAATGRKLWDFKTQYALKSSPAVADGIVYFGSDDYSVYAVDAVTGTKLWSFETDSHASSSPVVANGVVYIGSMDGTCYGLHSQNGRYRLGFRTYQAIVGSPAVNNGTVYVNTGGFLYAIDGKARNWPGEHDLRGWWLQFYAFRIAPPPPPISGYLWRLRLGMSSSSSPVVVDNLIYTSADNRLYRIDTEKFDINKLKDLKTTLQFFQYFTETGGWIFTAGGNIRSTPAFGGNALYVGSEDGRLYAIDAATGKKLWDFRTGDKITSSPALVGDTVYVASQDGKVYAIK